MVKTMLFSYYPKDQLRFMKIFSLIYGSVTVFFILFAFRFMEKILNRHYGEEKLSARSF